MNPLYALMRELKLLLAGLVLGAPRESNYKRYLEGINPIIDGAFHNTASSGSRRPTPDFSGTVFTGPYQRQGFERRESMIAELSCGG